MTLIGLNVVLKSHEGDPAFDSCFYSMNDQFRKKAIKELGPIAQALIDENSLLLSEVFEDSEKQIKEIPFSLVAKYSKNGGTSEDISYRFYETLGFSRRKLFEFRELYKRADNLLFRCFKPEVFEAYKPLVEFGAIKIYKNKVFEFGDLESLILPEHLDFIRALSLIVKSSSSGYPLVHIPTTSFREGLKATLAVREMSMKYNLLKKEEDLEPFNI